MVGEEIAAARVAAHGLAGDRAHTLVDGREGDRRLSARAVPGVLEWAAAYSQHPDDALEALDPPPPLVTAPDGRCFGFDDPELPAALAADLDRPIALRRLPGGEHDRRGTVLLTFEATRCAVETALGRPLALRRFRPNLHLELDAVAFAEEGWAGRRIDVGEVRLRVREPCERCAVPTRDRRGRVSGGLSCCAGCSQSERGGSARSPRSSGRGGWRAAIASGCCSHGFRLGRC